MNCDKFQERIALALGGIELNEEERVHLESCTACREFYNDLVLIESSLADQPSIEMTAIEFAKMQTGLDRQIAKYRDRAFGFYNWMVRYGISAAALVLIFAVSLVSNFKPNGNDTVTESMILSDQLHNYSVLDLSDTSLDDNYVDAVFDSYQLNYGGAETESVIGEINENEFEYLYENLEVGELL